MGKYFGGGEKMANQCHLGPSIAARKKYFGAKAND